MYAGGGGGGDNGTSSGAPSNHPGVPGGGGWGNGQYSGPPANGVSGTGGGGAGCGVDFQDTGRWAWWFWYCRTSLSNWRIRWSCKSNWWIY